jgi:hypothetical protein
MKGNVEMSMANDVAMRDALDSSNVMVMLLTRLLDEVQQITARFGEADRSVRADETAPLTAKELCERWGIQSADADMRLFYLARKCRAWGLRPLKGTRGWKAVYSRADVLHAESYAAGKINRRRNA